MKLRISEDLALPTDAVTETFAVLGRRGSGKTYTAGVLVEELLETKHQVVIIDPLDVWWGLRSSADGKGDGYPVTIFGGQKADVPLQDTAGALLADVVVDHGISAIFSLRHLSKAGARRFVGAFGDRLYERKGDVKHRAPLHLVVDEADAFVPQSLADGGESCYGAIDTIVRRGRSSGFGTTLISQRSAVIAKDVLTQTEILVSHQTTSPQDRKALKDWIQAHDSEGREKDFMASLASLPRGTAWFWSPGWLDVFKKIAVRKKRTFDSSETPRGGARPAQPKRMTPVDLEQLAERMAATVEEAKAKDPTALRQRVRELEAKIAKLEKAPPEAAAKPARVVEKPVLPEATAKRLVAAADTMRKVVERLEAHEAKIDIAKDALLAKAGEIAAQVQRALTHGHPSAPTGSHGLTRVPTGSPGRPPAPPRPAPRPREVLEDGAAIPGAQQRVLDAALRLEQLGIPAPDATQLGLWAGIAANGGYWRAVIGWLRSRGYVEGTSLTDTGRAAAQPSAIQTVEDMHRYAIEDLAEGKQRDVLRALIEAYPKKLDLEEIRAKADVDPNGGYWRATIGRLRSLGLATRGTPIGAAPILFLETG